MFITKVYATGGRGNTVASTRTTTLTEEQRYNRAQMGQAQRQLGISRAEARRLVNRNLAAQRRGQ